MHGNTYLICILDVTSYLNSWLEQITCICIKVNVYLCNVFLKLCFELNRLISSENIISIKLIIRFIKLSLIIKCIIKILYLLKYIFLTNISETGNYYFDYLTSLYQSSIT